MSSEAGHIQITEFSKEVIPQINWMMEDLFCQYGVSIPWFMCDFKFPDYSGRPDWLTYSPPEWYLPEWKAYWPTWMTAQWPDWLPTNGFSFGSDWGAWGYWLAWFNEQLGLLFDAAGLPRWQMPDLSPGSWAMFNSKVSELYEEVSWTEISAEDEDNIHQRLSSWPYTYNEAIDSYINDPIWPTPLNSNLDLITQWNVYYAPGTGQYNVWGVQTLLKFDTSSWSGITAAKIMISGMTITQGDWADNPVLQIYEYDYNEPFGSGDWTGGTKIAEQELLAGSTSAEIDIDSSRVNAGGNSKYRFTLKAITDEDFFPTGPDDSWEGLWVIATDVKLAIR